MMDKMRKQNKNYLPTVEVLQGQVSCPRAWVAQETGPLENSPSKKCCLIDNYVIISFFHA